MHQRFPQDISTHTSALEHIIRARLVPTRRLDILFAFNVPVGRFRPSWRRQLASPVAWRLDLVLDPAQGVSRYHGLAAAALFIEIFFAH